MADDDDDDDDVANEANKSDEKDLKIDASKAGKKRPAVDSPKVVPSEKKAKVDAAEKLGMTATVQDHASFVLLQCTECSWSSTTHWVFLLHYQSRIL
jgi:hypothetical protein